MLRFLYVGFLSSDSRGSGDVIVWMAESFLHRRAVQSLQYTFIMNIVVTHGSVLLRKELCTG